MSYFKTLWVFIVGMLIITLSFLYNGATFATPIQSYNGTPYLFKMVLPCAVNGRHIELAMTELEELNAIKGLVEGETGVQDFITAMVEADPQWAATPERLAFLLRVAQGCFGTMKEYSDDQSGSSS